MLAAACPKRRALLYIASLRRPAHERKKDRNYRVIPVSKFGMRKSTLLVLLCGITSSCPSLMIAQTAKNTTNEGIPASTQVLLDGVKRPESKETIKSVLMITCRKDNSKGTGFILSGGRMVATNSHVLKTCLGNELEIQSPAWDEPIKVVDLKQDSNRDLALLCLDKPLPFGLVISDDEQPMIETEVETWGYPLSYGDRPPILSRGYVAGYSLDLMPPARGGTGIPVNRLIVNGAFNPGNSGGPLIDRNTGKVIGVVVEKWTLWSPLIETAINGFAQPRTMMSGTFSRADADGKQAPVSDQVVISAVLKEFYEQSQVMIGTAVSVSELNAFLKSKGSELSCGKR